MRPKTIVALVMLALLLIIVLQNTKVITLWLLFWKISMSQILWTSLTLVIGFSCGFLVAKLYKARSKGDF